MPIVETKFPTSRVAASMPLGSDAAQKLPGIGQAQVGGEHGGDDGPLSGTPKTRRMSVPEIRKKNIRSMA